jgi:hypothetical protein
MASDLQQLLEFGFEEEKAKLAIKKTSGCMFTLSCSPGFKAR